jgi:aminoglycoside phosphotransferase
MRVVHVMLLYTRWVSALQRAHDSANECSGKFAMALISHEGLTKLLTLLVFKVMTNRYARRFFRNNSRVILLSKFCIKSTPFTSLAEAEAMRFVFKSTSIPVPKVYKAFEHKGRTYIVMERLPGQNLSVGWAQRSDESKARIFEQLRSMIQKIRDIPPPEDTGVSNICGGPICDQRLPRDAYWGPYPSIREFHRELRNGIEADSLSHDEHGAQVQKLISFHDSVCETPIFTHGDLSSLNLLADGDRVVGIVDWETAGWMPSYWEYTSACDVNPQNRFWAREVDNFLHPQPHELEMEKIRKRYFGDR